MYGIEEDKPSKTVYICPKCDKCMANDPDSIKKHEEMFCAKYQKEKAAKEKKPAPKKKTTTKKNSTANVNTKRKTGRKKS